MDGKLLIHHWGGGQGHRIDLGAALPQWHKACRAPAIRPGYLPPHPLHPDKKINTLKIKVLIGVGDRVANKEDFEKEQIPPRPGFSPLVGSLWKLHPPPPPLVNIDKRLYFALRPTGSTYAHWHPLTERCCTFTLGVR
jgi:hypothetical protein